MLHLIQKSPFQSSCLKECLNIAKPDDQFLLMLDGVYALQDLDFINNQQHIFILQDDLTARGLTIPESHTGSIKAINYDEFVELTINTSKTISWF